MIKKHQVIPCHDKEISFLFLYSFQRCHWSSSFYSKHRVNMLQKAIHFSRGTLLMHLKTWKTSLKYQKLMIWVRFHDNLNNAREIFERFKADLYQDYFHSNKTFNWIRSFTISFFTHLEWIFSYLFHSAKSINKYKCNKISNDFINTNMEKSENNLLSTAIKPNTSKQIESKQFSSDEHSKLDEIIK